MLADIVRTDRHNHRQVAGDSELADAIKLLARTHQNFVWQRQRHINRLRSNLREFYPQALEAFGTDLSSVDAVAILSIGPTPELGRRLSRSKIASALKKGGRQKNIQSRAEKIQLALRSEQLEAPQSVSRAYGVVASSLMRLIAGLNEQITDVERELESSFEGHPDAKILRSLPGLGISAPGCLRSSEMTEPATWMLERDATTPGPRRSQEPPAVIGSCWPVTPATSAYSTPATCGRSHR